MKALNILVIDDTYAPVAKDALEAAGHRVTTATSYAEGLALLREGECDLALIDIFFPKGEKIEDSNDIIGMMRLWKAVLKVGEDFADNLQSQIWFADSFHLASSHPEESPLGVLLGQHAKALGIPYLQCTSEHHHSERLECLSAYMRKHEIPFYEGGEGKYVSHGKLMWEADEMPARLNKARGEYWLETLDLALEKSLGIPGASAE